MGANTQALGGRRQVRLPAWIVVGTALALTGALAIATLSDRDTGTRVGQPEVTVAGSVAGSPDDVAEIAALKAARALGTELELGDEPTSGPPEGIANRGSARRFPSAGAEIAWLKANMAHRFGRHS